MGVCKANGASSSTKMLCNQAPYVVPQENTGGGSNGGGSNGGGRGSSGSEKLSAGDDVGITVGVLALIAIVFVIGLFAYRSKQETKRTDNFLGGDDM